MIITDGKAYPYKGGAAVQTAIPPADHLSDDVRIVWHDSRFITREQQKKIWAMIGEIADYCGNTTDDQYEDMKSLFVRELCKDIGAEVLESFSTAQDKCDIKTASMFIDMLIRAILAHDIPTHVPLVEYAEDIHKYVYACLLNKKCAVCGAKADLHHIDRVGMGNNRREVDHIGRRCLPLCRIHHNEAHDHGDDALMEEYHLEPVEIDEKIVKLYKLGGKKHE